MYETTLARMIAMYRDPAWRKHAVYRVTELDADNSGLFTGILADFQSELRALRSAQEQKKAGGLDENQGTESQSM
jgi:hypothetical protein